MRAIRVKVRGTVLCKILFINILRQRNSREASAPDRTDWSHPPPLFASYVTGPRPARVRESPLLNWPPWLCRVP